MSKHVLQTFKALAIILCLLGLAACSFRFLYNHVDFGLVWKVDDYFDLNSSQKDFLEEQFVFHLQWHRQSELVAYVDFLQDVQRRVASDIVLTDVHWFYDQLSSFKANLGKRMLPDAIRFFTMVNEEQMNYLRESLEDENKDYIERAQMTAEDRAEKRASMTIDNLTEWTGGLSEVQEAYITQWSNSLQDVTAQWLAHRRSRQEEFVQLVQRARRGQDVSAPGYEWFTRSRPDRFSDFYAQTDQMVLAVYSILTDDQKQYLHDEIQDWIEDIQSVLAEK